MLLVVWTAMAAWAGDYTEEGIEGFVDEEVNPVFTGWATGYIDYFPASGAEGDWTDPENALGPVTGDHYDIVSLGDLDQSEIDAGDSPGEITLTFDTPIANGDGYDFVVFENGFFQNPPLDTSKGFFELAYVEVSSDGTQFVRFDSDSQTSDPGVSAYPYLAIDPTDVYNLAGKHPNAYETSEGTGFDLSELTDDSLVLSGDVDLNNINYIRIIDIPGSGDFADAQGDAIYDGWVTYDPMFSPNNSGGFDLEAVGVIHRAETSPVAVPGPTWLLLPAAFLLLILGRRVSDGQLP
jgi:hypothetical protein